MSDSLWHVRLNRAGSFSDFETLSFGLSSAPLTRELLRFSFSNNSSLCLSFLPLVWFQGTMHNAQFALFGIWKETYMARFSWHLFISTT